MKRRRQQFEPEISLTRADLSQRRDEPRAGMARDV